jgi:hypothetical protein
MNAYFQKNFIGTPFGYACDVCNRLWYMNDLKHVKEKHISTLAAEFPHIDVAQFKASVTCTEIMYPVYQAVTALCILPIPFICLH